MTTRSKTTKAVELSARAGYLAKGSIYLVIGILAVMAAVGSGGGLEGGSGAVREIASQPFGQLLLVLLAIGLGGYCVWRLVQAVFDPEHKGNDKKGIAKRLGYALSGVIHGGLAIMAIQILAGQGGGGNQTWATQLLATDAGQPVFVLGGIFVVGTGLYQIYKAATVKFRDVLKTGEMSPTVRAWTVRLGRAGLAARGVIFAIMGYFLVRAGMSANAAETKGIGEALAYIAGQSYGTVLLALVAIGLIAYGAFTVIAARYRRIPA